MQSEIPLKSVELHRISKLTGLRFPMTTGLSTALVAAMRNLTRPIRRGLATTIPARLLRLRNEPYLALKQTGTQGSSSIEVSMSG